MNVKNTRALRVVDWDRTFETAQSRKVGRHAWVSMPNMHDSCGFRTLMCRDDGLEIYGCWSLLVQVASRCEDRGLLVHRRRALTAREIAVRVGAQPEPFERAISVLLEPEIGWLEWVEVAENSIPIPPAGSGIPAAGSRLPANGIAIPGCSAVVGTPDRTGPDRQTGPDPDRPKHTDRTDPIGVGDELMDGAGSGREPEPAPDRIGVRWRELFVVRLLTEGFGRKLGDLECKRQRRPFKAVASRFESDPDRERILDELIALAKEKANADLDNPFAAWQKDVDRQYPGIQKKRSKGLRK